MAAARPPQDAAPLGANAAEALQVFAEARSMLAAGRLEMRCLPYRSFAGSDSCAELIDRFADFAENKPEYAIAGDCAPAVCRTVVVGYRRDAASSISVFVTLEPVSPAARGAFRIAAIEIAEGADTSD